jgi:hypothetical protein
MTDGADSTRLLFGDQFTTETKGGFVVYYVSPSPGGVTAFKPVSSIRIPHSLFPQIH